MRTHLREREAMYEKFTDRARRAVEAANDEARRFNHEYIGTEHILLALIAEGTGVAANVLKTLGVDLPKVRREVLTIVQRGPDYGDMGRRPMTPRAKKIIEYATEEARGLGHQYVGTEHLLLGTLRESEGVAAQVLMNLGLRLDRVRAEVLKLLRHGLEKAVPDSPADADPAPAAEIQHLPAPAGAIVAAFDGQIDLVKEDKEKAVGAQAWETAAELRDLEYTLRKLREEFISRWPRF
jgi:ATP-dependent Clp protease ATP-binding subunit ClpC